MQIMRLWRVKSGEQPSTRTLLSSYSLSSKQLEIVGDDFGDARDENLPLDDRHLVRTIHRSVKQKHRKQITFPFAHGLAAGHFVATTNRRSMIVRLVLTSRLTTPSCNLPGVIVMQATLVVVDE